MTDRERVDPLLHAAVKSALSALSAASPPGATPAVFDAMAIERSLAACLVLQRPAAGVGAPAVKAACRHLRRGELIDAYLALHAALRDLEGTL